MSRTNTIPSPGILSALPTDESGRLKPAVFRLLFALAGLFTLTYATAHHFAVVHLGFFWTPPSLITGLCFLIALFGTHYESLRSRLPAIWKGTVYVLTLWTIGLAINHAFSPMVSFGLLFVLACGGSLFTIGLRATRPLVYYYAVNVGITGIGFFLVEESQNHAGIYLLSVIGIATGLTLTHYVFLRINRQNEHRRRRWQTLIDAHPEPIAIQIDDSIVYANDAFVNAFKGRSQESFFDRSISDLVAPEQIEAKERRLNRVQEGERVAPMELKMQRLDGGILYMSSYLLPITYRNRNAVQIILQDITDRKRSEHLLARATSLLEERVDERTRELKQSNKKLRREIAERRTVEQALQDSYIQSIEILESVNDAFYAVDHDWCLTYVNKKTEELWDRPREELIGKSIWDIFPRDEHRTLYHSLQEAAQERQSKRFVTRAPVAGHWIEVDAYPSTFGLSVYFRDITERKKAEEKLRRSEERFSKAFRLAPTPAFIVKLQDREIIDINERFVEVTGYSREEVIGRSLDETSFALGDHINKSTQQRLRRKLEAKGKYRDEMLEFETKDGEMREVLLSAELTELNGETCVLGMFHDLTERRRLERELLEVSTREQRRVGQDLHDGLASQLTGIAMLTRALAMDLEGTKREELEEIAHLAGKAASDARTMAQGLNPVKLDKKGLEAALEELRAQAEVISDIPCRLDFQCTDVHLPENSATHMYWIAKEAVNNAVKHAEAKSIQISLAQNNGYVELKVTDDGTGLSPDVEEDGGMGLHIMRSRAELIGAELEIDSSYSGTQVRCRLPYRTGINPYSVFLTASTARSTDGYSSIT